MRAVCDDRRPGGKGRHLVYVHNGSIEERPLGYMEAADAEMVDVGEATRYTVTDLEAGEYLFAVTALDEDGNESDFSDPLPVEVGP